MMLMMHMGVGTIKDQWQSIHQKPIVRIGKIIFLQFEIL